MKVKPFNAILITSMRKFLSALLAALMLLSVTARIAQTDPVLSNAVAQANQNQEAVIYRQSDLEELFKSLS